MSPKTPEHPKNRPIIHLTLDFDGTLTSTDTTTSLGALGLSHLHHHHPSTKTPHWDSFVTASVNDISSHDANYTDPDPNSNRELASLIQRFQSDVRIPTSKIQSLAHATAYYNSLKDVESASYQRVLDSGIFSTPPLLTSEELEKGGRQAVQRGDVQMQVGWDGFLSTISKLWRDVNGLGGGIVVDVLSVNWSRSWVRGCLRGAVEVAFAHAPSSISDDDRSIAESAERMLNEWNIVANEMPGIEGEACPPSAAAAAASSSEPEAEQKKSNQPESQSYPQPTNHADRNQQPTYSYPIRTSADKLKHYLALKSTAHARHARNANAHEHFHFPSHSTDSSRHAFPSHSPNSSLHPHSHPHLHPHPVLPNPTTTNKHHPHPTLHIYIGDSPNDLECLLAADMGISIRASTSDSSSSTSSSSSKTNTNTDNKSETENPASGDEDSGVAVVVVDSPPPPPPSLTNGARMLRHVLESDGGLEVVHLLSSSSSSSSRPYVDSNRDVVLEKRKKRLAWVRDLEEVGDWLGRVVGRAGLGVEEGR